MWRRPSSGAVKSASTWSVRSPPVKAAPWTTHPSSGRATAVRALRRKIYTFSGQGPVW